jgi:hypothetical protein
VVGHPAPWDIGRPCRQLCVGLVRDNQTGSRPRDPSALPKFVSYHDPVTCSDPRCLTQCPGFSLKFVTPFQMTRLKRSGDLARFAHSMRRDRRYYVTLSKQGAWVVPLAHVSDTASTFPRQLSCPRH